MILDIPALSQIDKKYRYLKFGNTNMADNGCLTMCIFMMVKYLGLNITLPNFISWLNTNDGYYGNLFVWRSVENLLPGLKFIQKYRGPQLRMIDDSLSHNIPCPVHVDFDPTTHLIEQHWILVVGKRNDSYIINDPRDGACIDFDLRYGPPSKNIYNVSQYRFDPNDKSIQLSVY